VARDHVELPFEVQVLPQHLPDGLRGLEGLRIVGQGDEVRHGVLRRQPRRAENRQHNLVRLTRRRLRGILGTQRQGGAGGDDDGGQQSYWSAHQPRYVVNVTWPANQGVRSAASTTRVYGIWALSFSSLTASGLAASNRHMQCDSPGTNVLRMYLTGLPSAVNCFAVSIAAFCAAAS